jgi:hypothetical protein
MGINKLDWPGNSPDLNAIEPCWPIMKRDTTKTGAPKNRVIAEKAWIKCWKDLPQTQIQAWIERIPHHIKQIIHLEGGNEYIEGYIKDTIKGISIPDITVERETQIDEDWIYDVEEIALESEKESDSD